MTKTVVIKILLYCLTFVPSTIVWGLEYFISFDADVSIAFLMIALGSIGVGLFCIFTKNKPLRDGEPIPFEPVILSAVIAACMVCDILMDLGRLTMDRRDLMRIAQVGMGIALIGPYIRYKIKEARKSKKDE